MDFDEAELDVLCYLFSFYAVYKAAPSYAAVQQLVQDYGAIERLLERGYVRSVGGQLVSQQDKILQALSAPYKSTAYHRDFPSGDVG